MVFNKKVMASAISAAIGVLTFPLATHAQEGSVLLEEVMVTATKRVQRLQDVGVSATAFNEEQLEQLNVDTAGEIANYSPNVEFKRLWGSKGTSSLFFIRGLGQADFNEGSETPATVYIDEFYVISPSAADFLLFDAERAEVIRGPQGTLFGRNSSAGAVSFFNNAPDVSAEEIDGEIQLHLGNFNRREVIGVMNVPLIEDKLAARFSYDIDTMDAYTDNRFDDFGGFGPGATDKNESDFQAFRGSLQWEEEDLTVYLKASYGEFDAASTGDQLLTVELRPGQNGVFPAEFDAFGYNESTGNAGSEDDANLDGTDHTRNEIWHGLLKVDYQITDQLSFKSITGWYDQDKVTLEDCDGSPRSLCANVGVFVERDYWTQEFRLNYDTDKMRVTSGLYYLDEDYFSEWNTLLFSGSGTNEGVGFAPNTPGGWINISPSTIERTSYAIYGHVEYDLSPEFTLSVGARWNQEENDATHENKRFVHSIPDTGQVTIDGQTFGYVSIGLDQLQSFVPRFLGEDISPNQGFSGSIDDGFLNVKFQLDWRPSDSSLFYASLRQGSKAGSFQNGFTTPDADSFEFDKETNLAYEVGAKWSPVPWARLNGAVFYYDYEDYQASAFIGGAEALGTNVVNRDAEVFGVEFEVVMAPIDGLDIMLTGGYVDTEVEDITNQGLDADGNPNPQTFDRELGQAPELQFSFLSRYNWNVGGDNWAAQFDYSWIDERFVDVLNDEGTKLDSYGLANVSLSYAKDDESWFVRAYVKNVADERGETQKFSFAEFWGGGQINFTLPRQYGVELGLTF